VARDLYVVLGVDPAADAKAITLAYRRLCRRYHPDVSRESDAAARIREVNAAYEVLGDPGRRLAYDRKRAGTAPPSDAWAAAYRQWQHASRPPPWNTGNSPTVRVSPGAVDFGFVGRGEIAVRPMLVRSLDGRKLDAKILTRGDWLSVGTHELLGTEATVEVRADPRDLSPFWTGAGPEEARLDGWLEIVGAHGSIRVPAGAILRRDASRVAWWNPFARKVS
jgi:hypothetical protein